jgi:hypothetical protein
VLGSERYEAEHHMDTYILTNRAGQRIFESNDQTLYDLAQKCNIGQQTLRAYLRAGGGVHTFKNGYTVTAEATHLRAQARAAKAHRYDLIDTNDAQLLAGDDLEPFAEYLGVTATYLYVRLSANKGRFERGRGQTKVTLLDHGRLARGVEDGTRGPKRTDYRYFAHYIEADSGSPWKPSEEVTIDDVVKQTGLKRSTVMQRFSSYQEVSTTISRAPEAYRYDKVVFRRVAPDAQSPRPPA